MNSTVDQKDFNVAVVGGGICGLAVAVGLRKAGIEVDIYEAADQFGEVGAGIALGPNAIKALRDLGILDDILARSGSDKPERRPNRFISGFGDHEFLHEYPYGPEDELFGIYRPVFIDALVHLIDPEKTHFEKRCVGLSQSTSSGTVKMNFADGTEAEADVVLGADGIRSVVRSYVVDSKRKKGRAHKEAGNAVFTNTIAYRGLVPVEEVDKLNLKVDLSPRPLCWVGRNNHLITFPTKNDTMINIVAFVCDRSIPWGARPLGRSQAWVTPRSRGEMLDAFADWGRDALKLLSCIKNPSSWSIHAINPPLDSYSRERVAILGDAAHGMLPHLGAGAGQGIEDALVLVTFLKHPEVNKGNIEVALKAYSLARQPHATAVLEASTRTGETYDGLGPNGPTIEGLHKDLCGFRDVVWRYDLQADIVLATEWLLTNLRPRGH